MVIFGAIMGSDNGRHYMEFGKLTGLLQCNQNQLECVFVSGLELWPQHGYYSESSRSNLLLTYSLISGKNNKLCKEWFVFCGKNRSGKYRELFLQVGILNYLNSLSIT